MGTFARRAGHAHKLVVQIMNLDEPAGAARVIFSGWQGGLVNLVRGSV